MDEYLLGIDNGGTVSKAVIFDLAGRELAAASQQAELACPRPGWTERPLDQLWQSTAQAIRAALAASGISPRRIVAVGACGHGNGLYLLDRSGSPLRTGIVSLDSRAVAIVAAWGEQGVLDAVWPRTLQRCYAAQPPALLRWLKLHEPEAYARVGAVLLIKDYIKHCLTGVVSTDLSDMSATGLLDVRRGAYDAELLASYGIAEVAQALPPLLDSAAEAGRVTSAAAQATGLAEGTPVYGGMFDVSACALGSGAVAPGQACIVAGTWSINAVVTAAPIADRSLFLNARYTPRRWLAVEASATSCANLEWFVREFCAEERAEAERRGISAYEVCGERVAALPPAASAIIFHPFLFGSDLQPSARAGFYGLAGWHTRADLLRALFEGVAYGHRSHVERLRAAGAAVDRARLTGGGARSAVWAQIFADVLGLPIEVPEGSEFGARGAALSAGVGAGVYAGYADAAARAVAVARRYEPDPAASARYRAAYAEYQALAQAMQEPWERLSRLGTKDEA
jgi:L-xylulokinase